MLVCAAGPPVHALQFHPQHLPAPTALHAKPVRRANVAVETVPVDGASAVDSASPARTTRITGHREAAA